MEDIKKENVVEGAASTYYTTSDKVRCVVQKTITWQICEYEGHIFAMPVLTDILPAEKKIFEDMELSKYTNEFFQSRGYDPRKYTVIIPTYEFPQGEHAIAYIADYIQGL